MSLRSSLVLNPPSNEHVNRIREIVIDIMATSDQGKDISEHISLMNAITGHDYDLSYFLSFHSHTCIDEFVKEAALPAPLLVHDITRAELIEIVRLAMTVEWPYNLYYRALFDKNVPMSGASSLLYYPENYKSGQNLPKYNPSPEEIVDTATAHNKIIHL